MFIIESVTKSGDIMRQTVRRATSTIPLMRARAAVELKDHRRIRILTEDGQSLFDLGTEFERSAGDFTVAVAPSPEPHLKAVA